MNNLFSILLSLLGLAALSEAGAGKGCVPPEKGFHYVTLCSGYQSSDVKIHVRSIKAVQGHPEVSVDKNGGIDLTQPLVLYFNLTTSLSGPIKKHLFDQTISQFIPDDEGGRCNWQEIDLQGLTNDIDACKLIQGDCSYQNKPTYVKSVINFPDLVGDATSGLDPGTYYGFKITERDGNDKINCFWLQAKVIKS